MRFFDHSDQQTSENHQTKAIVILREAIMGFTVILLVVVVIGIYATYSTFTQVVRDFLLTFLFFERPIVLGLLVFLGLCLLLGLLFAACLGYVEIQIRRQRVLRFAPTPQGYYEALWTKDGFYKPEDNVPLTVPHTYSPKLTVSNRKSEEEKPYVDDETILELYNQGLTLRTIVETTGRTYYQVQKITSASKNVLPERKEAEVIDAINQY